MSRVQKLSSLYLYNLDDKKIKVSTAVENEMKRLRQDRQKNLSIPLFYALNGTSLKIVYHNATSLHRHLIDVKSDCNLLSADILAFSETHFQPTDTGDFNSPGFKIARFDSTSNLDTRPYHGQTVYDKCQGSLFWGNNVCNIEIVIGNIPFLDTRIHVCFIYCPPKEASLSKLTLLFQKLNICIDLKEPVVKIGDFNFDIKDNHILDNFFSTTFSFKQLIVQPTTDYGTILDHVYTNIATENISLSGTLESYYSDHKPVFIIIAENNSAR